MLIPQTGRAVLAPASFGQGRHRRQPAHPCQWRSRHPLPGVRRCRAVGTLLPRRARRRGGAQGEPSIVPLANSWDVSVSSDGRDPYVPDATNSQIASFSIGPAPSSSRRAIPSCWPQGRPASLPAEANPAALAAGQAESAEPGAPRNRLLSRGSAGAHQGASPARAASRPAKSSPQGPQARRCAAMPG